MPNYYMGVDGGGSNVRVVVVDDALAPLAQWQSPQRVNPNVIGYDNARQYIQNGIREASTLANVPITAVGLGIAGARGEHGQTWMRETAQAVLPNTLVTPASDNEIALVGANGAREGVLILAGTGSIVFGVNANGETCEVGGWGYLMGDEGSGYWLGMQALRAFSQVADGLPNAPQALYNRVKETLKFNDPLDLLAWLYADHTPNTSEIAKLASVVLEVAQAGDTDALNIVSQGAQDLAQLANTVMQRLNMASAKIAFAGGLLEHPTPLALALCSRLGLNELPKAQHTPLIGASLLAKLTYESTH